MSEERRSDRDSGPDSASRISGSSGELKEPSQARGSPWLTIGAMLAWRAGKKLVGGLLPQSIVESEINAGTTEGTAAAQSNRSPREDDRNLTLESETNLFSRRRWGNVLAVILTIGALCGGVGFLFVYWTGGSNEALGGCLAVFFGGLAAGLIVTAHLLTVHREATEPREDMEPPIENVAAAREDFHLGEFDLLRRRLLQWMAGIGASTVAVMFVSLLRSIMPDPNSSLYSDVWKRGQRLRTADGKPVKADALAPGSTTIVFPEDSIGSEKAQTVLVRVDPQLLELPSDRAEWAPLGNIAFSRVCTHAGCPVGMYEKTAHLLMCPCHQSTFEVLRAAQPSGGPAARPLPQLPLYVDAEGVLCAGGGFSEPPGPGFWGMPS